MKPRPAELVLITGERNSGKTWFCQQVVEAARRRGWQASGLISPGVLAEDGQRVAIEVEDLRSGERRRLAWLRRSRLGRPQPCAAPDNLSPASAPGSIQTMDWAFDARQLEWGNQALRRSIPTDLLVIDELGPLEFERQQGWLAGLLAIDSAAYRLALVVIRPALLAAARARWPGAFILQVAAVSHLPLLLDEFASRFFG